MRMTVLTVGGIAVAAFINTDIPDKSLLHLGVMGVAAIVSAIGIGIYEDAADARTEAQPAIDAAADNAETFAPPHTAH